ncbi:MAG TPA: winged helix-turn-helix domain-containing protein [Permianibacter sp.]|nr:winged helix-turn-helix domain-containing protein [Permianibacter sp.]
MATADDLRAPEPRTLDNAFPDLRNQLFRVDDWLVDPRANRIERDDAVKTLRNKAMELLVLLASQPGQVVLRDEIVARVWDGNDYVASKGITNTIWTLRQCLGDTADTPRYIETIAKRGYRLIAPVVVMPLPPAFSTLPESTMASDNGLGQDASREGTVSIADDAAAMVSLANSVARVADSIPLDRPASDISKAPAVAVSQFGTTATAAVDVAPGKSARDDQLPRAVPVANQTRIRGRFAASVRAALGVVLRQPRRALVFTAGVISVAAVAMLMVPAREHETRATHVSLPSTAASIAGKADVRLLQTTPEIEYPVAMAPDGKRFAYGSRLFLHQSNSLWLRELTPSAKPVQLKQYAGQLFALAWAPDGRSLAVASANEARQCELSVLDLQTLQSQSLGRCADGKTIGLAWSDDGRYLATSDVGNSGGIGVVLIERATGSRRMLTEPARDQHDLVGDFSPDASKLLVVRQASPSETELWQLQLDGQAELLWHSNETVLAPTMDWWTPNEVLLAVGREGAEMQLYSMNPIDGSMQALGVAGVSPQHVAPTSVLFVRSRQHFSLSEIDLRQQPLRVSARVQLDGQIGHPAYLDNEQWLFMSNLTGHMEIYRGQRQGRPEQLTDLQRMAWDPAASPDGRWLAFAGQCGGDARSKICLQDRRSGQIAVAFSGEQSAEAPRWQADGNALWFRMAAGDQVQIGRLPVAADGRVGAVEWLASLPTLDVFPAAHGNGFYWVDKYRPGIWQRDLASGTDRLRVAEFPAGSRQWAAQGDALFFLIREADRTLTVHRQRPGAAVERLGQFDNLMLNANGFVAVSPDGQRLLVSEVTALSYDPAMAQSPSSGGYPLAVGQRRLVAAR